MCVRVYVSVGACVSVRVYVSVYIKVCVFMLVCVFMKVCVPTHLLAAFALIWLLSTVHALVSLQVVALDESHVTHVAGKRLLA